MDPLPTPENPPTEPTLAPSPEAPKPAPPPAAKVVLEGTKTERELALERDLKSREQRLAELEDENRQLKTIPKPQPPKKSWEDDLTFFDED